MPDPVAPTYNTRYTFQNHVARPSQRGPASQNAPGQIRIRGFGDFDLPNDYVTPQGFYWWAGDNALANNRAEHATALSPEAARRADRFDIGLASPFRSDGSAPVRSRNTRPQAFFGQTVDNNGNLYTLDFRNNNSADTFLVNFDSLRRVTNDNDAYVTANLGPEDSLPTLFPGAGGNVAQPDRTASLANGGSIQFYSNFAQITQRNADGTERIVYVDDPKKLAQLQANPNAAVTPDLLFIRHPAAEQPAPESNGPASPTPPTPPAP
ncbi:MAG: hypothetical protein KC476_11165 [Cyanobacteria bacterium HKST-UBA06]|nr:hypothetical protein [Cyanobacteria bacterium HKST-UBA06]